jgi:hypothetical protein
VTIVKAVVHMKRSWKPGSVAPVFGLVIAIVAAVVIATGQAGQPAPRPTTQAKVVAAQGELARLISHGVLAPGQRVPGPEEPRVGGLNQVEYDNWSGYADDNSSGNTYTKVSGSWTQPAVTCPTNEDEVAVFWVGLDGFDNSTVEQDGTLAQCYKGTAFYYTWWEMYPTNSITTVGNTLKPGDQISASVNYAKGKYKLALTDQTSTANSFSLTQTCGAGLVCNNASADWIAETPSYNRGLSPWPQFGTWKLTAATATSGTAGTISAFPDDEITILGTFGEDLATTGALNRAGNAFGVTWAYTW